MLHLAEIMLKNFFSTYTLIPTHTKANAKRTRLDNPLGPCVSIWKAKALYRVASVVSTTAHRVLNGDGLPHDVDLAGVDPLIVRGDVTELEAVVIAEAHPGVFPDNQVSGAQDPVGLLPHHHEVVQVCHVAGQHYRVALLRSEDL